MTKACARWAVLCVGSLLPLGLAECGGTSGPRTMDSPGASGTVAVGGGAGAAVTGGAPGVAGSAQNTCVAPSTGYEPAWTPPSSPVLAACTMQQAADEWALCESTSSTFDQKACRAFEVDPVNSACLGCMFGALGRAKAGALLVLPGGEWIANRGGCIALIDGDTTETGCGAITQAADVCVYSACLAACTFPVPDADYAACQKAASSGPCSAYVNKAACSHLPRYASCNYATFSEYYDAMVDLFCVSGQPLNIAEGGAAGAGP